MRVFVLSIQLSYDSTLVFQEYEWVVAGVFNQKPSREDLRTMYGYRATRVEEFEIKETL